MKTYLFMANPNILQRQAGRDSGAASEVTRVCLSMPSGAGVQALRERRIDQVCGILVKFLLLLLC